MKSRTIIRISDLETDVRIGTLAQERSMAQKIKWQIAVYFLHIPKACKSDQLNNTVCYDFIVKLVQKISQNKVYNLLEHLVWCLRNEISHYVKDACLHIKATKSVSSSEVSCAHSFELVDEFEDEV